MENQYEIFVDNLKTGENDDFLVECKLPKTFPMYFYYYCYCCHIVNYTPLFILTILHFSTA